MQFPDNIVNFHTPTSFEQLVERWGLMGDKRHTVLAPGWAIEAYPYNHLAKQPHWFVLDEKGRERAKLWADKMVLSTRYSISEFRLLGNVRITVRDHSRVILQDYGFTAKGDMNGRDTMRRQAREWLDREFPNHADPFLYWNCP